MVGDTGAGEQVIVVLDPHFGERLHGLPAESHVWVILSALNEPVMRALWAAGRAGSQTGQVTGMQLVPSIGMHDCFLDELPMIELHHPTLSAIEVIGLSAEPAVQTALQALGFAEIVSTASGFRALRHQTGED